MKKRLKLEMEEMSKIEKIRLFWKRKRNNNYNLIITI